MGALAGSSSPGSPVIINWGSDIQMASMKKRAQSAKRDDGQEGYSCTNQEVLNALFIGVNNSAEPIRGQSADENSGSPVSPLKEP